MQNIPKNALFIIDGSYLLYRSFYAIRPLYTSAGIPTQATYGFCRTIKKLIDDFDPAYVAVAWDGKTKTFRSTLYAEYKATRQAPPRDLFDQKTYILKFLDAIKMPSLTHEGYEADDIIAALAEGCKDHPVVLVCPDKDMYQLLSDNLTIFDPFKNRFIDQKIYTAEEGFPPSKVPFFYALVGDTSDNIPGVAGIGEKTAKNLVTQFASLEDLYNNLDKVDKERTKKLLTEQKDKAFLSLQLFTLKPPPLLHNITMLTYDKHNWSGAAPIFRELEFGSMLKEIEKHTPPPSLETNASIFGTQQPEPLQWKLVVPRDEQALKDMIAFLTQHTSFGLDTETSGCMPLKDSLVGISFAADKHTAYYVPLGHTEGGQIERTRALELLRPLLESTDYDLIMQHAKFDQLVLWNNGIAIRPVAFDTLLAANLVRKEWQKINLKELSLIYLHEPMKKFDAVLGKRKSFADVPLDEAAPYGAHDALQTFKLKPLLQEELDKEPRLKEIFHTIEMPFYWVLVRMEQVGILLDPEVLAGIGTEVTKALGTLENKIFGAIETKTELTRTEFNLNSPRQIERLLFDILQLPVIKKSDKGQRSTDHEVLQELRDIHPIPGLILQHRELSKLKNTYITPLPTFINPTTGRVHTTFSQTMVATGRISSSDPNMQNIPTAQGFGIRIRSAFIAPPGKILMSADYSQIELRVLAYLTQDPTLIAIFNEDRDIHTETAAQLFGVALDQVTPQQRQLGKRINFSIMYGMSPFGLAKDLGIKQSDAKAYIEKYFAHYATAAQWMEKTVEKAVTTGYVETWFGRRRYIPELKEKNKTLFDTGRRMAINTPVQGTQAEIMKIAMINIDKEIVEQRLDSRMILQIHDEIIIELPEGEEAIIAPIVRKEMERVVAWNIPLKVTLRTGKTWADITK
ncbi:MAG: DNA polymerase I [Candidatus Babeliales bacterium]